MARPANFFRTLDGTQVLYDRLSHADYGNTAMDTKHHGRRNRPSQTVSESILNSLTKADPLKSFARIDTGWREDRSKRCVAEIKKMKPVFNGKVYDAANKTFV